MNHTQENFPTHEPSPISLWLNLSEPEYKAILKKSGSVGLSIANLLEHFVRDLIQSENSHSEEWQCAADWFDRCSENWIDSSGFYGYLCREDVLEDTLELWELIQESEAELAQFSEHPETLRSAARQEGLSEQFLLSEIQTHLAGWKSKLKATFAAYQQHNPQPGSDWRQAMEQVQTYVPIY